MKNVKVMPIPSLNGNGICFALTFSLGLVLTLTACSKGPEKAETSKTETQAATTATTTGATTEHATDSIKDKQSQAVADTSTSTIPAPTPVDEKAPAKANQAGNDDMPQISAASRLINLANTPDSKVICTVNGTPITIADFKNEFRMREEQTQALLSMQPELESQLLEDAKANKLSLTDVENNACSIAQRKHKAVKLML